jgi:tetratricopeptide (TPR) repeat protein
VRVILFLLALPAWPQETTPERLIEAGHWKQARSIVERRLRETPQDPNLIFLQSQIHNAFGDRTTPLPLAEKAVALAPGVARYHRQLAEVRGVMAQHANAFHQLLLARRFRKEIDAAIALDPSNIQAQRDLLEFYLLAPGIVGGDVKRAEAIAQTISGIDAAEGLAAKARIAAYRKDYAKAEALTQRAAEAAPSSYKLQIALAQFYMAPEHPNESAAEAAARKALALDATRVDAYAILAPIYAGRGDWTSLDAILEAAIREVPDDAAPYYRAAERLLARGTDPARAERYLRKYLSQEPEGNQPTIAEANRKLALLTSNTTSHKIGNGSER